MSGAESRSLAERLAGENDDALARLLALRGVAANVGWRDFFDAADALLASSSVEAALRVLPLRDLLLLAAGGPVPAAADVSLRMLADEEGRPLPAVRLGLDSLPLPPLPRALPVPADAATSAQAAERAFTALSALADIVMTTMREPLTRVGADGIGVADRRRLVQEEVVRDAAEADDLVALADATGLIRAHGRRWYATPEGAAWVREPTRARWVLLATAWRDALPSGLRTPEGGWPAGGWREAYPLDESWPERADRWFRMATVAGFLTPDGAEPAWTTALRAGGEPEPEPLVALLPGEVDRVFLQNDLTAVSPGPLAPALDVRLRGMALRESHAQASTYRFTEATIAGALSTDETEDGIRAFLGELSLTGIPQPLDYLIARTAERHGLVRVSLEPETGRTIVSSRDHQLLATIGVDQALQPLGLVREGALLRARASRDTVYWALVDARYPVVAIDDDGKPLALHRDQLAPDAEENDDLARYRTLIRRLRDAHGPDVETAWLERELDSAVRNRTLIVVEVEMPGGDLRELTLEATGLGGGRLRGRSADVERTLPVSLIRSVRPAP